MFQYFFKNYIPFMCDRLFKQSETGSVCFCKRITPPGCIYLSSVLYDTSTTDYIFTFLSQKNQSYSVKKIKA